MGSKAGLAPLASLRISKHFIQSHGLFPNTSIQNKPLVIYHSAFSSASASSIESHLIFVGVVEPQWRYTMYSTSHFHSTTHEVLCISNGRAKLCFGGEDNEGRVEPLVEKGDVIVVPAGVAHRLLDDFESGFEMVGSYPKGHHWDMCYGKKGEEGKVDAIAKIPWFSRDPVYGNRGPALEV
ncbi:cupin domain-containing protein [Colletotrichum godetiae]|uniref:Cupin domain-containing protein n=1 Tax=Colletotrichum godetiae TaxID=1209918 RepID=A0AAJ0ESY2_9PEZI|nr:cupin domain-containing protein [Colletotrichum godetiae]KAK1675576.1 cupin domain-containing protein [Colletotrichum godetiae]